VYRIVFSLMSRTVAVV